MKVFKNLFGDGSKIHSDEIVYGDRDNRKSLSDFLNYNMLSTQNNRDFNTMTQPGDYSLGGDGRYENAPFPTGIYGYLEVRRRDNTTFFQTLYRHNGEIWHRASHNDIFSEWKQIV